MKICITGGSGFIGRRLLNNLLANDFDVRLLTRKSGTDTQRKKHFYADLTNQITPLTGLFQDVDIVYHCAGEVKNPQLMHAMHVDGTSRLLEELSREIKTAKKPVHWVQLSSVGAYGPPASAPNEYRVVTEDTPHAPVGPYEVTKTISDELVMKFAASEPLFTYTILRPSNVIGPSMPNQSLRSLVRMIKKRLFFYIGSQSSVATYIHVDDVVGALVLCGNDLRARGQVFNLSNDCMLSEIVNAVAQASGFNQSNICIPEKPLRFLVKLVSSIIKTPLTQDRIDALVRRTYYPSDKIREVLGFVPQCAIPSAVSKIFEGELKTE